MLARAARAGIAVSVVPVGFAYEKAAKWRIIARFGEPRVQPQLAQLEADVRRLSVAAS